jgi:hypothetical protein
MNDHHNEDDLRPVLQMWTAPEPPAELDDCLLASFREHARIVPLRRRLAYRRLLKFGACAAAIVVAVLLLRPAAQVPPPLKAEERLTENIDGAGTVALITKADLPGFKPVAYSKIEVIRKERVR